MPPPPPSFPVDGKWVAFARAPPVLAARSRSPTARAAKTSALANDFCPQRAGVIELLSRLPLQFPGQTTQAKPPRFGA